MVKCAKEAVWLCDLVNELGVSQNPVKLHCDNQSVIYLAKDQVSYTRTKHIDVRYYKLKEIINDHLISLVKIYIDDSVADIFTKLVT